MKQDATCSAFSGPAMRDQLHAEHLLCLVCANLSACGREGRVEEMTEEGLSQLLPLPLFGGGRFALLAFRAGLGKELLISSTPRCFGSGEALCGW